MTDLEHLNPLGAQVVNREATSHTEFCSMHGIESSVSRELEKMICVGESSISESPSSSTAINYILQQHLIVLHCYNPTLSPLKY